MTVDICCDSLVDRVKYRKESKEFSLKKEKHPFIIEGLRAWLAIKAATDG